MEEGGQQFDECTCTKATDTDAARVESASIQEKAKVFDQATETSILLTDNVSVQESDHCQEALTAEKQTTAVLESETSKLDDKVKVTCDCWLLFLVNLAEQAKKLQMELEEQYKRTESLEEALKIAQDELTSEKTLKKDTEAVIDLLKDKVLQLEEQLASCKDEVNNLKECCLNVERLGMENDALKKHSAEVTLRKFT